MVLWELMMKLIKREINVDPATFKPQIILTIALDLEPAQDQMALNPDEYRAKIALDFVEMLEKME
jgi:hypothetical protein